MKFFIFILKTGLNIWKFNLLNWILLCEAWLKILNFCIPFLRLRLTSPSLVSIQVVPPVFLACHLPWVVNNFLKFFSFLPIEFSKRCLCTRNSLNILEQKPKIIWRYASQGNWLFLIQVFYPSNFGIFNYLCTGIPWASRGDNPPSWHILIDRKEHSFYIWNFYNLTPLLCTYSSAF